MKYRNVVKLASVILCVTFIPCFCLAQFTISGRVLNQASTKPVGNASVFLSNASIGAKTNDNGIFALNNVKQGKYELVVSIVGFETYHHTVVVNGDLSLPDITLLQKNIVLDEVKIVSKTDPSRDRNIDRFEHQFLGVSELAKECKILNPQMLDIDFDEEKARLTASSADFLEIENTALGYKLKYLLTNFVADYNKIQPGNNSDRFILKAEKVHYEGFVLFGNIKGKPAELRRWQRRRQQVYEGSEMHFLRSAIANQVEETGFRVLQAAVFQNPQRPSDSLINAKIKLYEKLKAENSRYKDSLSAWNKKLKLPKVVRELMQFPLHTEEMVNLTDQKGIYALGCNNDELYVSYNADHRFKKKVSFAYLNDPDEESTVINFNTTYAFFDNNGWLIDPNSLSILGAWGKERVAGLLPVDYEPIQNNTTKKEVPFQVYRDTTQHGSITDSLLKITTLADNNIKIRPRESIYLQLDKPNYTFGDTIWFKAYLFHAPTHSLSNMSKIMYVDVTNDSSTFVKQYRLQVKEGVCWGDIPLDDFPAGNFTIRAYTNWMRNFGSDCFFVKRFVIADVPKSTWLANSNSTSSIKDGKLQVNLKLQLRNADKTAVANKTVQLELKSKQSRLYKQIVHSDANGMLDLNFKTPENPGKLTLIASDEQNENSVIVPINLNRVESPDVQFLPEGGNLVAGLPAHIGFKAINEDGKGIAVSGIITDHNQNQKAAFQSTYNGMGSFYLSIDAGEAYTAKIKLADGTIKEYPLPKIKASGTVLNVLNPVDQDSLTVKVSTTNDIAKPGLGYFLIGKSRGVICYAAVLELNRGNSISKKIAKSLFPTGITHFVLTNQKSEPLNERLVFINHNDNLEITTATPDPVYNPHDSIAVHISVADINNSPVAGNFSMAVTDDAQVKPETINNENIITRQLLTDELKGYVEEPGYYFEQKDAGVWAALDNLLLTQGWVNFDWQETKDHPVFEAEHQFEVKGRVLNAFNGAVKSTKVTLLSKSPLFAKDTLTDVKGAFVFRNFPVIDTPVFLLKAVNRHDKSFNVQISVDDIKPPAFTLPVEGSAEAWAEGIDSALLKTAKNNHTLKEQKYLDPNSHLLREVKIIAKKVVKDSQNLNGPGEADLVLDEKDMIKEGKKNWLDILQKNVTGFRVKFVINKFTREAMPFYAIGDKVILFSIDGILYNSVFLFNGNVQGYFDDEENYFKSRTAEEIKGIELNATSKYLAPYVLRYLISPFATDVIEITTRTGTGPGLLSPTPGTYLYKPLPLSWPAHFYKPRYALNDTAKREPDFRSAIDWEPNIITNKNGNATVSFYAADKPGTYTYIIEGTDGNGNLGYKTGKIVIGKTATKSPKPKSDSK